MPEQLKEQIETHLHTFPERAKELDEMKKEWKEFKARFFWAMVAFISFAVGYGVWVGSIQTDHTHLTQELDRAEAKTNSFETRITSLEVNNGEIRSRLTSIEVTLQEIKAAIIKLQ
jgi:septal ring factor EnvC (AmiA/AmiB activator)